MGKLKAPKIKQISFDDGLLADGFLTRDATLRVEGKAKAGATLTLFDNGVKIGKVKADKKGAWSFDTAVLADGAHAFKAKAKVGKDKSPFSKEIGGGVDATAPAAPTIDLASASDSGRSSTDNRTNDNTPTLAGAAEVGSVVTIHDGATVLGTATANGAGKWTFTTAALSDGVHSLTASAADAAGNIGKASAALAVTVDRASPFLAPVDLYSDSDTGGSERDNLTSDNTLTLFGKAEAGSVVTIRDGATVLGSATTNANFEWTFTTGALSEGVHSLTATAVDAAGNVSASGALAVTIDRTGPAAPTAPDLAAASDTGTSTDDITAKGTLTLGGTTEPEAVVFIYDTVGGQSLVGSAKANGAGQWSAVVSASTGAHSYAVQVFDFAGNVSVLGAALAVTVQPEVLYDLTFLGPAEGFIIQGDAAGDRAGSSVSWVGDVNGDGFADMIVGAPEGDDGGSQAGEAYVIFGSGTGFGSAVGGKQVIDLTALSAAQGFVIQGVNPQYSTGTSVSSAGDVNGDGFDDMFVGAPNAHDGGTLSGSAYVVFGSGSGLGSTISGRKVVDLETLSAESGFVITGDEPGDRAGISVSSLGDINGDGFSDVIIGAHKGDDGGLDAGEAYVLFGKPGVFGATEGGTGRQVIDLTSLAAGDGFIIQGSSGGDGGDYTGISVSGAGDVNGDGFEDLVIGAPRGDDGATNAGVAYVVFGKATGFGTPAGGRQVIDLTSLAAADGFRIQGDSDADEAGGSVSSAGDVNGDGYDDLLVGAQFGSDGGLYAGEAYVIFGKASGFGTVVGTGKVVDLTSLSAADGFIIQGDAAGDRLGYVVSRAGDVNGDGLEDMIVGATGAAQKSGTAYVVFGTTTGFGTAVSGRQVVDLSALGSKGFIIRGDNPDDRAGYSASAAGDVNGDGYDDVIVGAANADAGGSNSGAAYVIFGGGAGVSTTPKSLVGNSGAQSFNGSAGNDFLSGGGGVDVLLGGRGNDILTVADLLFRKIDGGAGTDKLVFAGVGTTGETIDFRLIADNRVKGIEAFDIRGTGNDDLMIGALDMLHFSNTPHSGFTGADSHRNLVIQGDTGDRVLLFDFDAGGSLADYLWEQEDLGRDLADTGAGDYAFYNLVRGGKVIASVAIESDMTVLWGD